MWGQVLGHHTWHPGAGCSRPGRALHHLRFVRGQLRRETDLARSLVLPAGTARDSDTSWPASVSSSVKWGCVIMGPFQLWRLLWFRGEGRGGETGGGRSKGLNRPIPITRSPPRALSGRLRLGLAEQSVLAALAQAVSLTPPSQGEPWWPAPRPPLVLTWPPDPHPHQVPSAPPGPFP